MQLMKLLLNWLDSLLFVGKNLGKRKLFESVSPKKTIEGLSIPNNKSIN